MRFSVMKAVDTLTSARAVEVLGGAGSSAEQAPGSHGHSYRVADSGSPCYSLFLVNTNSFL